MRNGNGQDCWFQKVYNTSPAFLSYLEEWKHTEKQTGWQSEYKVLIPTYEEWKPLNMWHWYTCERSSYPTYEEWKHELVEKIFEIFDQFLPTPYEEMETHRQWVEAIIKQSS